MAVDREFEKLIICWRRQGQDVDGRYTAGDQDAHEIPRLASWILKTVR
jgi:hypothetical protein